jgi:hypothetical protein
VTTRGKNEVTLTFAGDSGQLEKTFGRVGAAAKGMQTDVARTSRSVGKDAAGSFDRAAESADNFDTKSMGAANAINGLLDVSRAWKDESLGMGERAALLAMGFSDIGSGLYNTLIPALAKLPGVQALAAAGQKALNFVMSMNPIGLVVAAVGLLIGAFILAYKKSETFRNIVTTVFSAVADQIAVFLRGVAAVVGIFRKDWGESISNAAATVDGFGEQAEDAGDKTGRSFNDAAQRTREFKRTLDRLAEATDQFHDEARDLDSVILDLEDSLRAASKAAKDNGRETDRSTEKGRANRRALIDLDAAHDDVIRAMRDNGATQKDLQRRTADTREEFIKVAEKMGFTREQARKLADRYGLIPRNVKTNVSAPGLQSVSQRVARLDNALAGLPASVRMEFKGVGDGPGRVGAGKAVARMRALAAGLPVYLTNAYRSPSHNARVGGSPTSYHMDAVDPAGDWGGPTWALMALLARARAAGGWRELLGPGDAGHGDHVHAAKSGGNRSGWTLVGEEGPELARLPVGSRVVPHAATRAMLSDSRPFVVNIHVAGRRLAQVLVDPLRREVQALGGVEAAFGPV